MSIDVLGVHQYHTIGIAALTVSGATDELEREVSAAMAAGVPADDLREAVLVATPFAGFPRALVALLTLNELLGPPNGSDAGTTSGGDGDGPVAALRSRGEAVFRAIHGPFAEPQMRMLASLPAAFTQGIYGEAYGRVLARERFAVKLRELIAVASLSVLELPRVMRAHAVAALRHGASPAEVEAVIRVACTLTARPLRRALQALGTALRAMHI